VSESIKWVDFQSIISMTIGFNAAYVFLPGFLNPLVPNIRTQLDEVEKYASRVSDDKREAQLSGVRKLKRDLGRVELRAQRTLARTTFLAAISLFGGIALLVWASVYAGKAIDWWVVMLPILLSSSFLYSACYVTFFLPHRYSQIDNERKSMMLEMISLVEKKNGQADSKGKK
jgi:hypothetical protein